MSACLKYRLSAPAMAVSCLPLVVGVFVAHDVYRSQKSASTALALNVRSVRAAEELAIGVRDLRAQFDRFLLPGEPTRLSEIPALRRGIDHWLAEAKWAAVTPHERELIDRLDTGYGRLFEVVARFEYAADADRPAIVRELLAQTSEVLVPTQEYLDYNEDEIEANSAENQRSAGRMVLGLLLLGVCGPISGLLAGYGIARAVSRSVVRLSVPVVDTAGALSQVVGPVTISASPSLDELEQALHRVAEQAGIVVERLRQSERDALRAEQLAALGQMAAGFAHEVRNPLMSMKLLVQSAAKRGAGMASRSLGVLEEEIGRLEELTSTFLEFSRPLRPAKSTFDARVVVEETAELVAGRAGQRDIRIDCDLPDDPINVDADEGQIRQVILNLFLNSLDAIGDGGAIRARLSVESSQGRWVELAVEDDGPGLPSSIGQKIFTPFVSTKPTGLGLGLSVCKRIAEAHGGEITAANCQGKGAVFTFRIPGAGVAAGLDRIHKSASQKN